MNIYTKAYEKTKKFIKEEFKFILLLIALILLFNIELPYVIYSPGGAIGVEKRISVEDANESNGKLQMAYVTMIKGSIPYLLFSKVMPNWDTERKDAITYKNESLKEMILRDKIYMQESIDNATLTAYKKAGILVDVTKTINHIAYITEEANTDVKIGDYLLKANGLEINSLAEYKELIESGKKGDSVKLTVLRDDKEIECIIKIHETKDGLKTGLSIITTYEYVTNPKLTFKSKKSESGPSGGLILSLGIYNALVKEDITKGYNIVGTGTIDKEGNIGPIGGVKYKLIGAVRNKADIFLCPEENYEEAMKVKKEKNYKIKIIKVSTFDEALESLSKLK